MRKFLVFAIAAFCLASTVHAEKADSTKPTNIEADQMEYDDVKQVNVFTGNVVLTRGTLLMKAGRAVVRQDPEGYQYATAYAAPGKLASYRQKRDGEGDPWVEAYAERIEYDNKTEIAKFFSKANLKRLEGSKVTDEVNGEYISYDGKTEFFTVHNTSKGVSQPGAGRVKVVIQPNERQLERHEAKSAKAAAKANAKGTPYPGTSPKAPDAKGAAAQAAGEKGGAVKGAEAAKPADAANSAQPADAAKADQTKPAESTDAKGNTDGR